MEQMGDFTEVDHLLEDDAETSLLNQFEDDSKFYTQEAEKTTKKKAFPKSIFFIVGSEFCERFSYYGLRTVLALYLANQLRLDEDKATSLYHAWTSMCYFTPLIGAVIADSWLGRYRTIVTISVIYAIGNVVLSLSATKPIAPSFSLQAALTAIGLFLIAFGTGGIKPCVSAFGGDQFKLPEQQKQVTKFFAFFYFSINAGSLLSTIVTPILREDVQCFGEDCYSLAFGVPALLMLIAIGFFLVGSSLYKCVSPEGNIIGKVFSCILCAVRLKLTTKTETEHWLDLAEDRHGAALVQDVKALLRVLVLYLPLPVFWALFDQQGSRWTFEATKMNGWIGPVRIKPDQMQVLNPLLIMMLIPVFDSCVYPLCSILTKPLQRIFFGGLLASLAFVVSGLVQMSIENRPIPNVPEGNAILVFVNPTPCEVVLHSSLSPATKIYPNQELFISEVLSSIKMHNMSVTIDPVSVGPNCDLKSKEPVNYSFYISSIEENVFILTSIHRQLKMFHFTSNTRMDHGKVPIRIVDSTPATSSKSPSSVFLQGRGAHNQTNFVSNILEDGLSISDRVFVEEGSYEIKVLGHVDNASKTIGSVNLENDSEYLLYLYSSPDGKKEKIKSETFNIYGSDVHILWLLPQYILISIGEIMFSITGLEFSFTQAPDSMKSVVQAAWLMTVAIGNLFVMVAVSVKFVSKQSVEFLVFAFLMFVDMLIFRFLAKRYEDQKWREETAASFRLLAERETESAF